MITGRRDLMLCKVAFSTDNLAAATETSTAADGVNINTKVSRRIEQGCPHRKTAAAARWRKDHLCLLIAHINAQPVALPPNALSDVQRDRLARFWLPPPPVRDKP